MAPIFLPDGRRVLYTDASTQDAADARLMVQSIDGGTPTLVLDQATDARLLPNGQLAFIRMATLMTVAFDPERAAIHGDPSPAMGNVMQGGLMRLGGLPNPGMAMFSVSNQGALAAIRGGLAGFSNSVVQWFDSHGESAADPSQGGPEGRRVNVRLSPDRARALVTIFTPRRMEMWLADWSRNVWTACTDCDSEMGVADARLSGT